ncbi:MAG TPA: hypothetical protein VKD72_01360 [Gemmataceae bacterium]|nr:hypothetical protein [Gemmataceae bacterium]
MLTITVQDGQPCVEIKNHKGKAQLYAVEGVASSSERLRVVLRRLDDPDRTYLVQRGRRWQSCTCRDWEMRRRLVGEACKHLAMVNDPDFRWFLSLFPAATEQRGWNDERN